MEDFRRLPRYFINRADEICNDMMFGWRPLIDLSKVKDNMINIARGFLFVCYSNNGLQTAYLQLLNIARTIGTRGLYQGGSWSLAAVYAYMKKEESMLAALAGCMQIGGGQVIR